MLEHWYLLATWASFLCVLKRDNGDTVVLQLLSCGDPSFGSHVANEGPRDNEPLTDIELHLCDNCYSEWVMDQYEQEFWIYWHRIMVVPINQ